MVFINFILYDFYKDISKSLKIWMLVFVVVEYYMEDNLFQVSNVRREWEMNLRKRYFLDIKEKM